MPASSWARVPGAAERLNMAVIGTGGMGSSHLRRLVKRADEENLVVSRVCDVYCRRLNRAVETIGGKDGSGTMEYREVLDDPDVQAVVIATPDHWHTKIAIEAMEAGKDVYCEKPLSLTIQQAIDCRDAVKRTVPEDAPFPAALRGAGAAAEDAAETAADEAPAEQVADEAPPAAEEAEVEASQVEEAGADEAEDKKDD